MVDAATRAREPDPTGAVENRAPNVRASARCGSCPRAGSPRPPCSSACSSPAAAARAARRDNGISKETPAQIIADVKAAVATATSVHVVGAGSSSGTSLALDLQLVAGKGGAGRISCDGLTIELVRIGPKLYFKGGEAFLRQLRRRRGAAARQQVVRRLREPAGLRELRAADRHRRADRPHPRLARNPRQGRDDDDRRPAGTRDHRHDRRRHALRRHDRARLPAAAAAGAGQDGPDLRSATGTSR